jgi:putative oxidoreductase
MDVGLLIVRLVVGFTMAAHGTQKLFGWFGGHGVRGTGGFFESLGFRPGRVFAVVGGLAELGGGLLFAGGLLTPLAAAAIVGMMVTAAATVHAPNGFFITNGGWEYVAVLAATATGVAFTGPGEISLDRALDWSLSGTGWGVAAAIIGLAASALALGIRSLVRRQHRLQPAAQTA